MSLKRIYSPTIVIFGSSGDLTHRKLVPALYNLFRKGRLASRARIVGFARRDWDDERFRQGLRESVRKFSPLSFEEQLWQRFEPMLTYFRGNLDSRQDFQRLAVYLHDLEGSPTDRLYYLATPPSYYESIVMGLGEAHIAGEEHGVCNIVVEKPFGQDLASAQNLNSVIHSVFAETQVYRIDHYLGKETAQNLLFLRFANTIFEPVWNRRYVDHIQITVTEDVDVEHRANFYDATGVLRDMFQNHLLQLYTLIAMEPPASFEADSLRNEKVKVLRATRPVAIAETVLAQYMDYSQTSGVSAQSRTPTYAAARFHIDNWRWKGVPFYLRSGKALKRKTSEIQVVFQRPPHVMFNLPKGNELKPNALSICIQPDEGIHLRFETKLPDSAQETRSVDMEFHYRESFGDNALPDAYERLLLDALHGDASLFARSDEIEQAWRLIDPIVLAWETHPDMPPSLYQRGSWGPAEAEDLLAGSGRNWSLGCAEDTMHGE